MDSEEPATDIDESVIKSIEALANQQRLEILVALAERKYDGEAETSAMSFTQLYDVVSCQSTSQFSYHLKQLVDRFIVETEDGYQLTYAGDKVRRALFSGLYEPSHVFDPVAVEGACPNCGARALDADSTEGRFTVECRECVTPIVSDLFPQSIAQERSTQEIVDSFGYGIWAKYLFVRGGVCPECYGLLDTTIQQLEREEHSMGVSINECRRCWFTVYFPIDVIVAFHPVVIEAFWQHGVSLLDIPLWELFEYTTAENWNTTVRAEEPFAASVEVVLDETEIRLAVDHQLSVEVLQKTELR
ncbi:winged helix-turn-helix domain-containing protein [Halogeometricum sp. S1BR25-6]|uniref:Winged helix-turn-helix domain-containing protein n=1 Tax=Halogeometricum salsisoli TaxID=2950536 RepID=A0ABU2GJK9_9EURY|nr:winged helix-turn-helix domain-containing protein [Halogeometricum sp. S1BR25-6]MDS0301000.1 winged helix-turn-helix domain-containing protein [Halogeometricum sp. S1BR25-6]